MKTMKLLFNKLTVSAGLFLLMASSCTKYLEELNVNPNGPDPEKTNPTLVLPTVLTETGRAFVTLGFGDISGVMQYTQKDGWTGGHNSYDWGGDNPWNGYYTILRNNQYVQDKAVASGDKLLEGIALTMKSMVFGLLTDLYGDIPYNNALKGNLGGKENTFPAYENQQSVYEGILKDLETASTLLSKPQTEYPSTIKANIDVFYGGNVTKWRKLANSLALRYYMRISDKLPQVAQTGIEKMVNDPTNYPLIKTAADDCTMAFAGNSGTDSWPTNVAFDVDSSAYRRIKMCNTFVKAMQALSDPRLGIWAAKVQIILKIDETLPPGKDITSVETINGELRRVRRISPDVLASKGFTLNDVNQDNDYVGLPVALSLPQGYNMSPDLNQASRNPHVSWLADIYKDSKGALLKARLMSAAEVNFIIAEAKAVKGWTSANAQQSYNDAIKASFDAWSLSSAAYTTYMARPGVVFNNTQKQIIEQKWIANWSNSTESWFDFRRTGFPVLHGVQGKTIAPELPLRFYYPRDEQRFNSANETAAAQKLQISQYSGFGADGNNNSPWSRMWLVQGTGKPW